MAKRRQGTATVCSYCKADINENELYLHVADDAAACVDCVLKRARKDSSELKRLRDLLDQPIDMILHCPVCGSQHIDAPEPDICICGHRKEMHGCDATGDLDTHECKHDGVCSESCPCEEFKIAWDNPPHKSHLCHVCKTVWRPADVPTNGVDKIKTYGESDTWPGGETDARNRKVLNAFRRLQ